MPAGSQSPHSMRTLRLTVSMASGSLDEHGDALPAADARRGNSVTPARTLQLARQREREPHPRRPQRMTDGDGAAVHVELRLIDVELAHAGEHLGAEGLVDLDA